MSQAAKDSKAVRRRAARRESGAHERLTRHVGRVNPLCAIGDHDHVSGWPMDFKEMAARIEAEVGSPRIGDLHDDVPNHDRSLLEKGAPFGCFTNRRGESIRPQYRCQV